MNLILNIGRKPLRKDATVIPIHSVIIDNPRHITVMATPSNVQQIRVWFYRYGLSFEASIEIPEPDLLWVNPSNNGSYIIGFE